MGRGMTHCGGDGLLLHVAEIRQQLAQQRTANLRADARLAARIDAVLIWDHTVSQLLCHLQRQL